VKQFAPSCDINKEPILRVLQEVLPPCGVVLEIGSGTGQHAVHFATHLPQHIWQPTELCGNFPSIRAWARERQLPNLRSPLELNLIADTDWPVTSAHAVVCINTIHIVAWRGVVKLFMGAAKILEPGGVLYVYGVCRYATRPLEPSNQAFDELLRARDPEAGVRDFEAIDQLAKDNGFSLLCDRSMPGNNRSIAWIKN